MIDKKYKCDMCNKEIRKNDLMELYSKYDKSLRKRHKVCYNCFTYIESFIKNFERGEIENGE